MNNITVKGPGTYWVVAYLGISTDDAVKVKILPNSTVTFPYACITPAITTIRELNDMSIKLRPDDTGNDDGYIQFNYLIKLGEFTLDAPPGTKCTVRIDVGYQVQITDGSGLDNMIATLLVIDKKMWDSSPSPKNYAWVPQKVTINNKDVNNTVAFTTDTNNMFNLLKWDGVVKAGVVSESTVIKDSKLPKITRDGK